MRRVYERQNRGASIWASLALVWLMIAALISWGIGAFSLAALYLPFVREWLKGVTLYDFVSGIGYWYAILMAVVGAAVLLISGPKDRLATLISGLGIGILILLVAGKLFL